MLLHAQRLEDVAAASAAMFVNLHLAAIRTATPTEAFVILQRFIAQSLFAHLEAINNWGLDTVDD